MEGRKSLLEFFRFAAAAARAAIFSEEPFVEFVSLLPLLVSLCFEKRASAADDETISCDLDIERVAPLPSLFVRASYVADAADAAIAAMSETGVLGIVS